MGVLAVAAESIDQALWDGRKLRAALGDPDRTEYSLDQLARRLESQLNRFDATEQRYVAPDRPDRPTAELDDVLAAVAGQLQTANLALAAARVSEVGDPTLLDAAIDDLAATSTAMRAYHAQPSEQRFRAEATVSPDLPAAVRTLTDRCESALDLITTASAAVAAKSATALPALVPKIKEAWDWIGKNVPDQLTDVIKQAANRFTRLALRYLRAALDWLRSLVPLRLLTTARDKVEELRGRLEQHEPPIAVMGWLIGIDGCRRELTALLARPDLAVAELDRASDRTARLSEQYRRIMGLAGGVATAATAVVGTTGWLGLTVPQTVVAVAAVNLLVIAAVLLIAMDHLDSGTVLGMVEGVRHIVRRAAT